MAKSLTCFAVPQRQSMRHKVQNLLHQPHICLFAGLQLVAKQATGSLPLLPSTSKKTTLFGAVSECNNYAQAQNWDEV